MAIVKMNKLSVIGLETDKSALFEELIKRVDFPLERIMNIDGKIPTRRFAEYKKKHGIE